MKEMKNIFESVISKFSTPYRQKQPVFKPSSNDESFDSQFIDAPFIYQHNNKWWMTYVGFDGKGYRTGLAVSENLLDWKRIGVILDYGKENDFDSCGAAGVWILRNNSFENTEPLKYNGKYWMCYYGNNDIGLEAGLGNIGLAVSEDLINWNKFSHNPILSCNEGKNWEKGTLYKGCLIKNKDEFLLFYNAKNKVYPPWKEQIGLATSNDLKTWKRYPGNPILNNSKSGWDKLYVADPQICRWNDLWIMFYYGFDGYYAQEGIAVSYDLIKWEKWHEPIIKRGKPGSIDSQCAAKPAVIIYKDVVYHFYVAVSEESDDRYIGLATSKLI